MSRPQIAIVGRPNVGKSSLLNRLAGRRVSIVEPTAGVTRDRVVVPFEWGGRRMDVVDTGGLGLVDEEQLKGHIESQIEIALQAADLVLFVVDGKEGLVPGDQLVARKLRRLGRPVVLAVNKIESHHEELGVFEWQRLGFGEPLPISAKEGFGIGDLCDSFIAMLPDADESETSDDHAGEPLKFAVVGKRNSGKSTLINRLCGEERVIVSEIPGTTRDAVDVTFELGGRQLIAIDTAGVRKKSRLADAIELFSYTRATESIRRADMVVHLFDIRDSISQVDKKVAHYCTVHHKPVVLVGNKVDLADQVELNRWDRYIRQQLAGLRHAPVSFVSAQDGTNVDRTIELLFELREQSGRDLPTAELNEVLQAAKQKLSPRSRTRQPKLFYGTQIGKHPLTVLVFVNEPSLFRGQYERYLQNVLRQHFAVEEVPVRLVFRERTRSARRDPELPVDPHGPLAQG